MDESGKLRVVRCPKCRKFLQEPADIPVYRCGGCDAILQAKNYPPTACTYAKISDGEKTGFYEDSVRKGNVLNETSEMERQNVGEEISGKEFSLETKENSSTRRSSTEGNSTSDDFQGIRAFEEPESSRHCWGTYRCPSKAPDESWAAWDKKKQGLPLDESIKRGEEQQGESLTSVEYASGFQRSRLMPHHPVENDCFSGLEQRTGFEGSMYYVYLDEGPSGQCPVSSDENCEQAGYNNFNDSEIVDVLEKEQSGLLEKLDDLRNRLSKSCNVSAALRKVVAEKRRMVRPNSYDGHEAWLKEDSLLPSSAHSSVWREKPVKNPGYLDNEPPVPMSGSHGVDMQGFYIPLSAQNEFLRYREPFGSQLPRIAPNRRGNRYPPRPSNGFVSSHNGEVNADPFIDHVPRGFYEQPPCTCFHCYNRHSHVSAHAPSTVLYNPQAHISDHMIYHLNNLDLYGSHGLNNDVYQDAYAYSYSYESKLQMRMESDLQFGIGGFRRAPLPHRSVLARINQHICQPIAGGAPFMTCHNCFKLLQLPLNFQFKEVKHCKQTKRNQYLLRCGACSIVISCTLDERRFSFTFSLEMKDLKQVNDYGEKVSKASSLDRYEISTHEKLSTELPETISLPTVDVTNDIPIGKASITKPIVFEKMQGNSSLSISSEDESIDSMENQKVSNSSDELLKGDFSSLASGSPLGEHFDFSPRNQVLKKSEGLCMNKCIGKGKVLAREETGGKNSLNDASLATEMDCSYNEFNSSTSQDSAEAIREDENKINKGNDSFNDGLMKKNFSDHNRLSHSSEDGQCSVSVNGQFIPDRLVKKAEKKAGPIHPGHYWYDFRAGFWGVMGHRCLGIIPPLIEEFNYSMGKNCSGGDTGVFVNARELHQKDLDLLASRGLPTDREKSYIVEISGRVFDEVSGEELGCLGKLAPTVEKLKHGFGMRVPRSVS